MILRLATNVIKSQTYIQKLSYSSISTNYKRALLYVPGI